MRVFFTPLAGAVLASVLSSCGRASGDPAAPASSGGVLTSVTISAPTSSIAVGATVELGGTAKDQRGDPVSASIAWSSSDPTKATVSASGLVTGVDVGAATIRVVASAGTGSVSDSTVVTVTPPPVLTSVRIAPATPSISVGGSLTLSATALDQFGRAIGASVTWTTSDALTATVSASGVVTGVAAGSATITATATLDGINVTGSATVIVSPLAANAEVTATPILTFNPSTVDIPAGGSVTWTFEATHNVTFTPGPGAPPNIGDTPTGSVSRTFATAGTFTYTCTIHGMVGTVVVH